MGVFAKLTRFRRRPDEATPPAGASPEDGTAATLTVGPATSESVRDEVTEQRAADAPTGETSDEEPTAGAQDSVESSEVGIPKQSSAAEAADSEAGKGARP